jgi:hypothetical protein
MSYTFEVTPTLEINIYCDGVLVGYQPLNPSGSSGSIPFKDVDDADTWAKNDISDREQRDEERTLLTNAQQAEGV